MSNAAANRRPPLVLFPGQPTPRPYDCVVEALRTQYYSRRTEEAYLHWIRRFLVFDSGTHPREMADMDVNRFLMQEFPQNLRCPSINPSGYSDMRSWPSGQSQTRRRT